MQTVQELIRGLSEHGKNPAIIAFHKEGKDFQTYKDLAEAVTSLAAGLTGLMRSNGRTIALCAENSPHWIAAAMAVIYAGGIILPVDKQSDRQTLRHILEDSGAGTIFAGREQADKIRRLDLPHKPHIYLIDTEEGEHSWRSLSTGEPDETPTAAPDDIAALFYTSGTTGRPKGVPLSHANLACQPEAIRQANLIAGDDRVLLPLPLHHVYPFVIGMLTPLALGLPIIFPASLTGREIIRAVAEGKASIIIGVPRLYRTVYEGIRSRIADRGPGAGILFAAVLALSRRLRHHFGILAGSRFFPFIHSRFGSSLRVLASGGSALDARLAGNLEGLGWQVAIGYGLTETSPLITINPPGSGNLQSVGKPVKGVEIRIDAGTAPEEASAAKTGQDHVSGQVLVRGPNVFGGYLHLQEETEKAFPEKGWFLTGDLGRIDNEGFLYLHGRAKTLIVTESGENLQPEEIEEAYAQHPAIGEIGVFFSAGRLTGIIVPDVKKLGHDADNLEDRIRDAVAKQARKMPSYKALADYVITREALPRTRLGKIRRHLLEERFARAKAGEKEGGLQREPLPIAEMSDHDQALLEDKNTLKIWQWLVRRYAGRRLTPDSSPGFDLGIDSLEWLDVSLEVQQRTGIELDEEAIGGIETIRDLLEMVSTRSKSEESPDPERPLQDPESVLDADQKRWLEPLGPVLAKLSFAAYHINRILMRSCFRLQVIGRKNLPEKQCLITPNHLSYLDPLIIAAALPYDFLHRTYFAGWTGVAFRNVFFRFASRLAQTIPIDSRHGVSLSLAFGAAVLNRGNNLIWFPEGRRSTDGTLQEFKLGISLLLEHYDVPVVPVNISGTHEAMPVGRIFPRFFRKITVTVGKPAARDELVQGQAGEALRDRIRDGLRKKVAGLQDDPRKGGRPSPEKFTLSDDQE
ncbi:MAG: AMP-binding protein [Desulfobulbaceae bacterium]|nr:AMP-binding protein [Desulfobulbaceae bacterium]